MDFQHCGEFFMLKKNSGRKNYNYTHNHNFLTFFACDIFAWKTARLVFKADYQRLQPKRRILHFAGMGEALLSNGLGI